MPKISIINNIPTEIDEQRLVRRLKIREDDMEDFRDMLAETRKIARPRGMYAQANIDQRDRGQVIIEDLKFDSKVLEVNLEQAYKVFPYIVTVGTELERWSEGIKGVLKKYWADSLKEEVLRNARNYLLERLDETYSLQDTADMNPGSLKDWPIDEQKKLFKLLGDPEA
ncbi:MAG: vitamin B12 dependent methionine synthase, partial [Bacillota bacterium]